MKHIDDDSQNTPAGRSGIFDVGDRWESVLGDRSLYLNSSNLTSCLPRQYGCQRLDYIRKCPIGII